MLNFQADEDGKWLAGLMKAFEERRHFQKRAEFEGEGDLSGDPDERRKKYNRARVLMGKRSPANHYYVL